ncbi:MAG: hypothetical protein GY746_10840 [Gammaproteobacteria bacterium]|nr:hypothetical protein [Gammaproteobacteria bacterium]
MDTSYESLYKRFKKAQSTREAWRSVHKEACEYCLPNRETFDLYAEGEDKTTRIYDSTAVEATKSFANRIQGSVIPAWQQWADLVAGSDVPEDQEEGIDEILQDVSGVLFGAINHSNFYQEIAPALLDLSIGTGCIAVEHGTMGNDLKFSCIPLSQLYPEKPINGVIESLWQQFNMPPQNIKATWPMAKLGDKLAKMAEKPESQDVQILNGQVFDPKTGIYHHFVMSPDDKKVMYHGEFKYKRFIPFRWSVTPSETFGRGVAIDNLSDVKTLNKMVEQYLAASAFSINPMFTGVSDGIFNPHTVRFQPGAIVPVGSNASVNPSLLPLQTGNNISHGSMVVNELQAKIKEAFFASPLGDVTDPVRSATENMLRMQEYLRRAGASFGRLNSELVAPLINSVLSILTEVNKVPPIQADGRQVKIRHQSPMAKTEQMEQFQNTQVWLQTNLSMLPPEQAQMGIKLENIPSVTADQLGIDKELVRSEEEKAEIAGATQAQMEQMNAE